MTTKITRINQIAKERPKEVFTSIYHLINYDLLKECYEELDGNKAIGLDKVTKDMYFMNLDENLKTLVGKLKTMSYKPSPARKVNIPKANGKLRGLAIANFKDKIVQLATKKLIEAIWEPKFLNNMFGFRPNSGCHDCLKYLNYCIERKYTNFILDVDIKGYFDNINHDMLIKCLEKHIKDTNLLRLIKRFLKAGVIENKEYYLGEKGIPQGSILSPVLANIYMYYADDMIVCFQHENIAKAVYKEMQSRLRKCGLEFAPDKTRLIEFGRFASENRKRKGIGKPETFDFLGFTHHCSKSNKTGKFRVKRKKSKKKFKQKVQEFKIWIKENRNKPLKEIMATVRRKLIGHYNYYGITDNYEALENYLFEIHKLMFKWLNRRSQKKSYDWLGFNQMLEIYILLKPCIKVNIYAI